MKNVAKVDRLIKARYSFLFSVVLIRNCVKNTQIGLSIDNCCSKALTFIEICVLS